MISKRRHVWRTIRPLAAVPARIMIKTWWLLRPPSINLRQPRRILLIGQNPMVCGYLAAFGQLFKDDPRIRFRFTCPRYAVCDMSRLHLARVVGERFLSFVLARARRWDMIVLADHHGGVELLDPRVTKVYLHHGYDSGKLVEGHDYRYGTRWVIKRDGQSPRYDLMFECSQVTRDKAVATHRALANVISVVGDLDADQMYQINASRQQVRRSLGFDDGDTVVLIMSTWGPQSMMETIGRDLLQQVELLAGRYKFLLSTHPHHWREDDPAFISWGKRLLQVERDDIIVVRPDQPWDRFAVACDLAISDHTSLAIKYALLNKPLMFIMRGDDVINPGSFGAALYEELPHLQGATSLKAAIDQALTDYPHRLHEQLAQDINTYPHQAAARISRCIYEILELTEPG